MTRYTNKSQISYRTYYCVTCIQDGTFLVRPKYGDDQYVYTISVVCNREIKHVLIRRRKDKKYAIGTPKSSEKVRRHWFILTSEWWWWC